MFSTTCKRLFNSQISRFTAQTFAVTDPNLIEDVQPTLDPLQHPDYFKVHNLFTVQDLFNAKVHLGHKEGSLNDHMKPFLYGSRLGHLIFDLDQTAHYLRLALNITAHIAYNDGIILLIARSAHHSHLIERTAAECAEYAHTRHWRNGTLTNSKATFGAVTRLPDLCILFNTLDETLLQHIAVRDAAKLNIPTVGVVDSNCNPCLVTYPVPGNDDSPSAIALYCELFKQAILRGKEGRRRMVQQPEP